MDSQKAEAAAHPVRKSVETKHRGVVVREDQRQHPKYAQPLVHKRVHGWCPKQTRV